MSQNAQKCNNNFLLQTRLQHRQWELSVNNTAKQKLEMQRWMVWRSREIEMSRKYGDIEKYDKDIDMVDPGSDSMPDLHGKHVGREARVGSKGKETIMIDDNAYHEGGVWYLDKWWPRMERMITKTKSSLAELNR